MTYLVCILKYGPGIRRDSVHSTEQKQNSQKLSVTAKSGHGYGAEQRVFLFMGLYETPQIFHRSRMSEPFSKPET
jgi:hypothetical protein